MKYYLESMQSVFDDVKSSENGLSSQEAAKRLEQNGKNKLAEAKKDSVIKRFFDQMKDPMIVILLVAAVVSAVTDIIEAGHFTPPTDACIILVVVIINAVLGVVQESKAEKAVEALQKMSAATTKVLRDGKTEVIKSEDLVVGDVILLDAGDAIPADCRIFECASMKIEEAALTGESVPVNKIVNALMGHKEDDEVPLGDRKNMAYMGSTLVYGRGKAVVVSTGMNTEMGKIANAISLTQDGKTPLELKLEQLSKVLTKLVVGICIFIFAFDIVTKYFLADARPEFFDIALDSFITAIALAVAAIPEGLVAVMTIVLALGVTNMSKKNAIIRKMTAVETLGCTQIICSDKTGTLTQNVMTVVDHFADDELKLATAMALCTNAEVEDGKSTGEPDEIALINYADSLGLKKADLVAAAPRVGEVPFDSGRKMMSTVHAAGGKFFQYTKGAPDEILKKCTHAVFDGHVVEMTDEIVAKISEENTRMGNKALRVFAAAYKTYDSEPQAYEPDALECDMTFIGLTGMIDPVRPEVKDAIVECREAGITPIMITGDHINTAKAIARELGILTDDSQAMMGVDIDKYSDEEFEKIVENICVYARVQPEHKTKIVNAWKNKGYVTAMTGDGVNDAPSIKSADIGVGMGITGTDVTKNVADMVLADDNFATIVSAVGEGRRIYDNIRKAIQFLLGSNLSEVLSIFIASILNLAPHLLFINLVTDCFPALALGMEKPEADIMRRQPRKKSDGIFSGGLGVDCVYQGIIVTVLTLIAFFTGEFLETGKWIFHNIPDSNEGMTMAFFTMSMCEIFHSFNMRSQRGSSVGMMFKGSHNIYLYLASIASLILTTAVVEIDFLSELFGFAHLNTEAYLISLGLSFLIIPIVEIVKCFQRAASKKKQ